MPKMLPFKAVRPTRDKVSLIASRSYQSYTPSQREARLENNPFSFLHIVNPGYKYHKEISGPERYELVKNRYQEFKEDGIFMQEKEASFYVYKIINRDGDSFLGVSGAASIEDYEENRIKRHENTIEDRELVFKEYLKTVGFNAEPVLLTYPNSPVLEEIFNQVCQQRAEYEFTTTYRDTHYLWPVNNKDILKKIQQEFDSMPCLYIADGHHRSSSSYLLAKDLKESDETPVKEAAYNYFMSYCIAESDLQIYEFNRLVKDLNGLSKEEFLIKLDAFFRIENRKMQYYKPRRKHQFSMYLEGEFYSLHLRKNAYKFSNALSALDAQILYETVLYSILGIEDMRHDNRIEYAQGKDGMVYVKGLVDNGEFKVGFGMLPVSVAEMKEIADEGSAMPPKTTYIEPKLRSGVTIYEF